MHEYRMKDDDLANQGVIAQEAYVICKVFEKRGAGPQIGAQYGAPFEEEEWDEDDDDDETSSGVVTLLANPNNNASGSTGVMKPGSSTITSLENERLTNVPVNDDVMLTQSDLAPMLCDNDTQEVEDGSKGKKVMTDDGVDIFKELADMSNLDDLGQDAFNMFFIDGSADDDDSLKLDAFLQDDFLD
ncbi:unnamed protein product [Lactuca virosa]|uniref:NAC domain-containing protein n=1 Tax=Lactuca virosa TaxID=75947 RepID=A0AAU9PGM6_9ASTR|nr:unnamed protein product [Lactuca virosa]